MDIGILFATLSDQIQIRTGKLKQTKTAAPKPGLPFSLRKAYELSDDWLAAASCLGEARPPTLEKLGRDKPE